MNFKELDEKLINTIKESKLSPERYLKNVLSYSSVIEKLYPDEFNIKMKTIGVSSIIDNISKSSGQLIDEVDFFNIDYVNKTINVKLGSETVKVPVIDVKSFIVNKMNIIEESSDYYFVLSFLTRNENYELFQITYGFILGN